MLIKAIAAALILTAFSARAEDAMDHHDHDDVPYHAFRLETEAGRYRGQVGTAWDLDGWWGGDDHKLWLKSKGEATGGKAEQAEIWAMYSRTIDTFWDGQIGLRQDLSPADRTYAAAGVKGLAPYFLDTELYGLIRQDGGIGARIRQETELLLTNRLIAKPYVEANLNAASDKAAGQGTGLGEIETGLLTRYEVTRRFAPYLDVKYRQKFGQTADFAQQSGEKTSQIHFNLGIRWLF